MRCPFCQHEKDKVIDSRETHDGVSIRRRRECFACGKRFTTYERLHCMVIKKNGEREPFDQEKLARGISIACKNRPITLKEIHEITTAVRNKVLNNGSCREIKTTYLGETVLGWLHQIDKVAYLRFASVHHEFKDVNQFVDAVKRNYLLPE